MSNAFTQEELRTISDDALATVGEMAWDGRQYDGVEKDKEYIAKEMARRLKGDDK